MARTFNGTNQFLSTANAIVASTTFTVGCWFNVANLTANHTLFSIGDTGSDDQYYRLYAAGADASDFLKADGRATNLRTASSSIAYSASTWQHGAFTINGNTITVYLNGANSGTNTMTGTPASLDSAAIGELIRATPTQFCNGSVAMLGVWSEVLATASLAQLVAGVAPSRVRPQALISCPPLVREIIDLKGIPWTDNNSSTVSAGPRQYAF